MAGGGSKQARLGCNSASNVGDTSDLLTKILLNLPVDSLLRCKLVAKSWYQLISEPQFARLHFSCSPKSPKFILYLCDDDVEDDNDLYLMDVEGKISPYVTLPPSLYRKCSLRLICSFNGLIVFTKSVEEDDLSIHICNPATQEVVDVPRGTPSAMTPSVGVLFDPDRNKYKILRFFCDESESEDSNWKYETYTPDGGDWSGINSEVEQCPVANPACPIFPTHVCVGGRMYWLVWSEEDREVPDYILSIDVEGNLTRLELPDTEFNLFTFLIDHEGRLAIVFVSGDETCVGVWSLRNNEESSSSWFFQGCAQLQMDGNISGINSIVSIGKEILFIIKPAFDAFFCFHFWNVAQATWRKTDCDFETDECEPVAFRFAESLFRCGVLDGN